VSRRSLARLTLPLWLWLSFAAGWAAPALARPGSGQSYSSGGGGSRSGGGSNPSSGSNSSGASGGSTLSGSSSSGSSGEFRPVLFFSFAFCIVGTCCAAMIFGLVTASREARDHVTDRRRAASYAPESGAAPADCVAMIRERDPEFSMALFENFARGLFARAHQARHDDVALARLAPYLSVAARKKLRSPAAVEAVIIGAMNVRDWRLDEIVDCFVADVEFEANLVVGGDTYLTRGLWMIERSARALTRPWEGVRTFGCPRCGAPLEQVAEELCASCGQQVPTGRFDWCVSRIPVETTERTGTSLTGTVPERGTDNPTIRDPGLPANSAALLADDPAALSGFEARLQLVFAELNAAWAAQNLRPARPYLTSELFGTMQRQVETYLSQGLVNLVDGARIVRWETVKLARDARHDALTVRLFGAGSDYTYRKATGEVVGGDKSSDRPYSEYWTLIRGSKVRGAPRADKSCPQCAGPLDVGMEGNCEHCGALVASGDFDWVLSAIEQDDSYRG
jgi:Tim44-like domain